MYLVETTDGRQHKFHGDGGGWQVTDRCIFIMASLKEPIKQKGPDGTELETTHVPIAVFPFENVRFFRDVPDEKPEVSILAPPTGFRPPPSVLRGKR